LNRIVTKKKVKLRDKTNLLVPINIRDYHWLLLNCDLVSNTFYVLDSMGILHGSAQSHIAVFKQFLQDYFHFTKPGAGRKTSLFNQSLEDNLALWQTRIPNDLTKQINGSDCGVHTCMNMEKVVKGQSQYHFFPAMSPSTSQEIRQSL
jgi:Ulp1 family protease